MIKKIAIYPGSFDPFTNGHLDILERALRMFDQVVVAISSSSSKQPLFSDAERIRMLQGIACSLPQVQVESFNGLLVDYARRKKAVAIIRGLRAISDFEYELQMGLMNRRLSLSKNKSVPPLETVYLMPDEKFSYLSSTLVKEVARLGGDIRSFVPPLVVKELQKKFK